MQMRAAQGALVTSVLLAVVFAGCTGSTPAPSSTGPVTSVPLDEGKGGIMGLLVNDIYRPVPGALILIDKHGLTATTDAQGQFVFTGLEPGAYVLLANAKDHEASAINVDVVAGQYTEVEYLSRRVFSIDGVVLTQQYSIFIDCSLETPGLAYTGGGCSGDLSGDSTRYGFITDMSRAASNATVMVTEVKFNKKGDYSVVIRIPGTAGATYFSEADVLGSDYVKIVNPVGGVNNDPGQNQGRNKNFTLEKKFQTAIFPHGLAYSELHQVCPPDVPGVVGFTCLYGAGPTIAVKANIVQSVFLGTPQVDIASYQVLSGTA